MADLMQYVRVLAEEIGPRPTTTDSEMSAAEFIARVYSEHGLEPEMQEFDAPRSYFWTYVIYHVLTIVSAVLAGITVRISGVPAIPLVWPAFAISAITAFVFWMDLDTRWGISSIMPKGPTQNVIGRIEPKSRRGERVRKVVVVAHYDSAKSSLAFAPSMVGGFPITFMLMKVATILVPVMVFLMALPWFSGLSPWLWYATMVVAAYLLIPMFIDIFGALTGTWTDGANDNASGVAAMLGVLAQLQPSPEEFVGKTGSFRPVAMHTAEEAVEADVVPEGAVLKYAPAGAPAGEPLPDDFEWAEPAAEPSKSQSVLDFDTIEFAAVGDDAPKPKPSAADLPPSRRDQLADEPVVAPRYPRPEDREQVEGWGDIEMSESSRDRRTREAAAVDAPDDDDAAWASFAQSAGDLAPRDVDMGDKPKKSGGLFGRFGKKKSEESEDVRGWLGVDDDFDARSAGRDIGTWDNFGGDDDDDMGWKGGAAGGDIIGDPNAADDIVARIRRKLEDAPDRDVQDKEVWFVATGAEESGTWGMRAFLAQYGEDVRDAFIINIDNVGAGNLHWVTAEGMARTYRSDRRLTSLAKRVSREKEILVKPGVYKGLSTDATPALARGYKAMSLMAFGGNGEIVNWHWPTDTVSDVAPELLDRTATLISEMIREI